MSELSIHDPYCAAFLAASGVTLKRIEPGRFTHYIFDNSDWRANAALGIWKTNTGQVNVTHYVRYLKQFRMFSMSNRQNGEMSNDHNKATTIG